MFWIEFLWIRLSSPLHFHCLQKPYPHKYWELVIQFLQFYTPPWRIFRCRFKFQFIMQKFDLNYNYRTSGWHFVSSSWPNSHLQLLTYAEFFFAPFIWNVTFRLKFQQGSFWLILIVYCQSANSIIFVHKLYSVTTI